MLDPQAKIPYQIDAMGQPCPMPLLLLKREIKQSPAHSVFLLKASDPNSKIDVSRYCKLHDYGCELREISSHEFHYYIHT